MVTIEINSAGKVPHVKTSGKLSKEIQYFDIARKTRPKPGSMASEAASIGVVSDMSAAAPDKIPAENCPVFAPAGCIVQGLIPIGSDPPDTSSAGHSPKATRLDPTDEAAPTPA